MYFMIGHNSYLTTNPRPKEGGHITTEDAPKKVNKSN